MLLHSIIISVRDEISRRKTLPSVAREEYKNKDSGTINNTPI